MIASMRKKRFLLLRQPAAGRGSHLSLIHIFSSVRFLTTGIAVELAYSSGLQRQALFSIGLVLFLFIMCINVILNVFLKRDKEG